MGNREKHFGARRGISFFVGTLERPILKYEEVPAEAPKNRHDRDARIVAWFKQHARP